MHILEKSNGDRTVAVDEMRTKDKKPSTTTHDQKTTDGKDKGVAESVAKGKKTL